MNGRQCAIAARVITQARLFVDVFFLIIARRRTSTLTETSLIAPVVRIARMDADTLLSTKPRLFSSVHKSLMLKNMRPAFGGADVRRKPAINGKCRAKSSRQVCAESSSWITQRAVGAPKGARPEARLRCFDQRRRGHRIWTFNTAQQRARRCSLTRDSVSFFRSRHRNQILIELEQSSAKKIFKKFLDERHFLVAIRAANEFANDKSHLVASGDAARNRSDRRSLQRIRAPFTLTDSGSFACGKADTHVFAGGSSDHSSSQLQLVFCPRFWVNRAAECRLPQKMAARHLPFLAIFSKLS
jgi:hypothetical protein